MQHILVLHGSLHFPLILSPHTKTASRSCSKLNSSPPSFLSHCAISWLYHSGNKQLDTDESHSFFFCLMTLFCPSPPATWSAKVPSLQSSHIHISHTHIPQQDVTFANSGVHRGIVCLPKRVISSKVCIHEGARRRRADRERQLSPRGPCCFCPLRWSSCRVTIQTCLTINLFGRDVSQSMTH